MKVPTPDNDDTMREALRRDAARVPEPAFDPALHYATMRRIRALAEPGAAPWRVRLRLALATTAAVLALMAILALWRPRSSPPKLRRETAQIAPRTSLLAYQTAAARGDDALLAVLDREATTLLPASAPVFTTALR